MDSIKAELMPNGTYRATHGLYVGTGKTEQEAIKSLEQMIVLFGKVKFIKAI